ncbi:MAG TPA: hypothetical protein VHL34_20420 [Rhizomicrobium sp.]|nr:hypothetical protein [Rhizomicrobium sp.]
MKLLHCAIALSGCLLVSGCITPEPRPQTIALTLKDLVSPTSNPSGPRPAGPYYGAIFVSFDQDTQVLDDNCIDQTTWSFIRAILGDHQSGSTELTASVTPILNDHPAVSVTTFISKLDEQPPAGQPKCFSKVVGTPKQVTAFMPSSSAGGFTATLTFDRSTTVDSTALQNVFGATTDLLSAVGGATGAAVVASASKVKLMSLAQKIDSTRNAVFSHSAQNIVPVSFYFYPADSQTDKDAWRVSIKNPTDTRSGAALSGWRPNMTLYVQYRTSLIRAAAAWPDVDEVLRTQLFSDSLGETNNIRKMVTSDNVLGFNITDLGDAATAAQYGQECQHITNWLGEFLNSDDLLVARYAIMRRFSHYNTSEERSGECFTVEQLQHLASLSSGYKFDEVKPKVTNRTPAVTDFFSALNDALALDANNDRLSALLMAHTDSFRFGTENDKPKFGPEAVTALRQSVSEVGCFQARKDNGGINLFGGVVRSGAKQLPALFYVDGDGKLEQVDITSVDTARAALGVSASTWPANRPSCTITP